MSVKHAKVLKSVDAKLGKLERDRRSLAWQLGIVALSCLVGLVGPAIVSVALGESSAILDVLRAAGGAISLGFCIMTAMKMGRLAERIGKLEQGRVDAW